MITHKEPRKLSVPVNFPITKCFTFAACNMDLNFLYSLTMARILKGYSTAEVSFLIGSDYDMIGDFEHGQLPEIMIDLVYEVIDSLDRTMNDFMCCSVGAGDDDSTYELIRSEYARYIEQTVVRTNGAHQGEIVYKLFEETGQGLAYSSSEYGAMEKCRTKIEELFQEGAFDEPILALDVYRICNNLSTSIDPRHVKTVLYELIGKRGFPKLKIIKVQRKSKYHYRKIAFQKITG